jgi:hypothetical protein
VGLPLVRLGADGETYECSHYERAYDLLHFSSSLTDISQAGGHPPTIKGAVGQLTRSEEEAQLYKAPPGSARPIAPHIGGHRACSASSKEGSIRNMPDGICRSVNRNAAPFTST